MEKIEYTLVRSRRRTLSLEVTRDLAVVVRAPLRCPQRDIDAFVEGHRRWIADHLDSQRQRLAAHPEPDEARRQQLLDRAERELPGRVDHYAALMGLTPAGISITGARTRFGSCSGRNRLCFSWRLMDYPDAAVDAVVVHELAHIVHKNHGPAFYALVESVLPDYRERVRLLR